MTTITTPVPAYALGHFMFNQLLGPRLKLKRPCNHQDLAFRCCDNCGWADPTPVREEFDSNFV